MLTEKKNDLERRMQHLLSEREGLSSNLDESSDRIMALERQCHEQEMHLRETQRELDELRTANGSLCERIESISRHNSHSSAPYNNSHHNGHSLLAEMDLSASSSGHGSAPASSPNSHPSLHEHDDIELDDIECDDPQGESSLIVEEENHKVTACCIFVLGLLDRNDNLFCKLPPFKRKMEAESHRGDFTVPRLK